eukprot:6197847-Pleurochrysis_carterae.AAC.1
MRSISSLAFSRRRHLPCARFNVRTYLIFSSYHTRFHRRSAPLLGAIFMHDFLTLEDVNMLWDTLLTAQLAVRAALAEALAAAAHMLPSSPLQQANCSGESFNPPPLLARERFA